MKASNDLILFEQLDQPEDRGTNEPPRAGERVPARIKIKIGGSGTGGGGREHFAVALYHPCPGLTLCAAFLTLEGVLRLAHHQSRGGFPESAIARLAVGGPHGAAGVVVRRAGCRSAEPTSTKSAGTGSIPESILFQGPASAGPATEPDSTKANATEGSAESVSAGAVSHRAGQQRDAFFRADRAQLLRL